MSKHTKLFTILGVVFILLGGILAGIGYFSGGSFSFAIDVKNREFLVYSKEYFETKTIEFDEASSITLDIDSADIRIKQGKTFSIKYTLHKSALPTITENNDNLVITQKNKSSYFMMNFSFSTIDEYIEITVPKDYKLSNLKINSDHSSNINISDITCTKIEIDTDFGNITVNDFSTNTADFYTNCGDIKASNFSTDTADFRTEYGNIKASGFSTDSTDFYTNYGDIKIQDITNDYNITYKTELGDILINDKTLEDVSGVYNPISQSNKNISVKTEYGNIKLNIK